jgi:hypothetical protein
MKRGRFPDGTQMRVVMPSHLYDALKAEAEAAGVHMADLVRLAVAERYDRLAAPQSFTVPYRRAEAQETPDD